MRSVKWLSFLLVSALLLGVQQPPGVAQAERPDLFVDALAAADRPASAAAVLRERFVTPRFDLFQRGSAGAAADSRRDRRLQLNLFPNATFTATLDQVSVESLDAFVWIGRLEGSTGIVTIAVRGDVMSGEVRTDSALYEIRYAGGDTHVIRQVDPSTFPPGGEPLEPVIDPAALDQAASQPLAERMDGSFVDVMVAYTPSARAAAGGTAAIESLIDLSIANTNTSYANSNVIQRVRLVHKSEIAYTEADFNTDLNRVTGTADGFMDNVHALRNTFGADLVALVINDAADALCGLAWLMNVNSTAFAANGFSANDWTCIAGNLTLAHEMGHNMSLNHDTANPPGPFPFSYGRGYNNGTRRDIMAVASLQPRMQNFSNPARNFVGTAEPSGTDDRNGALALDNTRVAVSNFCRSIQPPGDLDGDGRSDLLWHNAAGRMGYWMMFGLIPLRGAIVPVEIGWRIVGDGDFNGDHKSEIVWRHSSGMVLMWRIEETTGLLWSELIANVEPAYTLVGTGDYNGDGRADILWRHASGNVIIWLMNGSTLIGAGQVDVVGPDWQIVSTGDLNGDRRADILWRHSSGFLTVWLMDGTLVIGGGGIANVDMSWRTIGTADFNGDLKADILWRHASGQAAIWFMDGAQAIGGGGFATVPMEWQIVGRGDYNGDLRADILWRHTSGQAAIWLMNGTTPLGGGGFTTIPMDWLLVDTGQPQPNTGRSSQACGTLAGTGTFASPRGAGTLAGPDHRVTGCPGFPDGDARQDFLAFTIGMTQHDSRVTLIYTVGPSADREIVPAIVRPDGMVMFDGSSTTVIANGNEHRRVVNLAAIAGGPLAAGTWYLRTSNAAGAGNAPSYQIVIDAPR